VIKLQYKQGIYFKEGLCAVQLNDRWVFINKKGKIALIPKVRGDYSSFSEGLCPISTQSNVLVAYGFKNLLGYIDRSGRLVIKPLFTNADDFKNGLARVQVINDWGYIDKKGNWIWKPTR
jgi:hypothetical protein